MTTTFVLPDGRILSFGVPFVLNDIQYPANWLELAGDVDLDERSITRQSVADQAPSLESVKANAVASVNRAAEETRLRYITPGDGQALTYKQKVDEARLILLDANSTAAANAMDSATLKATYPMIWSSIPSDGATPEAVATLVHGMALAWAQTGALIEKMRRDALSAIEAATTADGVAAAASVDWSVA